MIGWGNRVNGEGERWVDIAHGGKSLHIASWDIGTVMFVGFKRGKLIGCGNRVKFIGSGNRVNEVSE